MDDTGWRPIRDGDDDPRVGGEELTQARQQAIDDILRLMDCRCLKSANCDHVDAVTRFGTAMASTTIVIFTAGIRTLPRPLTMQAINKLAAQMTVVPATSANPEHQHEHREGRDAEARSKGEF